MTDVLLIGAGNRLVGAWDEPLDGARLVTLDLDPNVKPDVVWDLNRLPLPFEDNRFDAIHCVDVLEHTGSLGDWRFFFAQWDEFWRNLKPGGTFNCSAPRQDSVWAWGDPGHVRVITEEQLSYLHRPNYVQVGKTPMTDYRPYFVSDWNPERRDYTEHHFRFSLIARKPAR